ncbi:DUF2441 domain-containing protein [Virgibacillus halodenitrificans]|uniref:DUF2441 domain-containing protein n=1 Tax=Virgibacillus halodenitrificans TaxID=1482 RepID=A0ABR7VN21_VIRHA|nr:DUF2441 domain-containing protein [Virgibacillus halodenitrificans]MBD1223300.1 DUF2441 domain-containing protein [Virgibacillus halodenitrificans]
MSYFHVSNDFVETGRTLASKYATSIKDPYYYQANDANYAQYLREMIFEKVREEHYPMKPSRVNSIYLFEDLEYAKLFAEKTNRKYIYSVTIESSGRMLHADMGWMDESNRRSYEEVVEIAHKYYKQEQSENYFEEVLFEGLVTIHEVMEEINY